MAQTTLAVPDGSASPERLEWSSSDSEAPLEGLCGSNRFIEWLDGRRRLKRFPASGKRTELDQERSIAGKASRLFVTALAWVERAGKLSARRLWQRAGEGLERGYDAAQ